MDFQQGCTEYAVDTIWPNSNRFFDPLLGVEANTKWRFGTALILGINSVVLIVLLSMVVMAYLPLTTFSISFLYSSARDRWVLPTTGATDDRQRGYWLWESIIHSNYRSETFNHQIVSIAVTTRTKTSCQSNPTLDARQSLTVAHPAILLTAC